MGEQKRRNGFLASGHGPVAATSVDILYPGDETKLLGLTGGDHAQHVPERIIGADVSLELASIVHHSNVIVAAISHLDVDKPLARRGVHAAPLPPVT